MATATKRKTRAISPDEVIASFDGSERKIHEQLRAAPVLFSEKVVGFTPHKAQVKFLTSDIESKRTLLPWARRFGKSWIVAVYIAWKLFSVKGYNAYVFAPSGEQSSVIFDYVIKIYSESEYLRRFTTVKRKGNTFTVGKEDWNSTVELVKTGLVGDHARGKGIHGKKMGLIAFDEVNSFIYPEEVTAAIKPFASISGGGIIYLGSPGEIGSWYHQTYTDWKQRHDEGSDKHLVIDCSWKDAPHIDPEFVAEERREATVKGRLWQFEREYEGKFTQTEGAYFDSNDVNNCYVGNLTPGGRGDVWIYSLDPGLDRSPSVLLIARFNQAISRLEIIDCRSLVRFSNNHVNDNDGHEKIGTYEEIIDLILDMRKSRPIHTFYSDPGTERNLGERLKNTFGVNVVECRIGGYQAKLTALKDLQRSLSDGLIVWSDHRITNQLLGFSPPINRQTGRFEFGDRDYDIIAALTQLNRYIGDRTITPFAVSVGARSKGDLW